MAVKWVDRVPTYPNRMKITPETGSAYYATVERADNPTVTGTPVNAQNLNAMQEAAGLTGHKAVYVATTGSDSVGDGSEANPFATINKAISTIPANLNGYTARIYIAAGTYTENVTIQNIGNGIIALTGTTGDVVTIAGMVTVTNVQYMEVYNISLTIVNSYFNVVGSNVSVHTAFSASGGQFGIYATFFSSITLSNTTSISNTIANGIIVTNGAMVYLERLTGSGNNNLITSTRGALCAYGTNEATATSLFYTANGGRIYSGAQTDVPKY